MTTCKIYEIAELIKNKPVLKLVDCINLICDRFNSVHDIYRFLAKTENDSRKTDLLWMSNEDLKQIGINPLVVSDRLYEDIASALEEEINENFTETLTRAAELCLEDRTTIEYSVYPQKFMLRIFKNTTVLNEAIAHSVIAAFDEDLWDDETEVDWADDVIELSLERKIFDSHPDLTEVALTMVNRDWLAIANHVSKN